MSGYHFKHTVNFPEMFNSDSFEMYEMQTHDYTFQT